MHASAADEALGILVVESGVVTERLCASRAAAVAGACGDGRQGHLGVRAADDAGARRHGAAGGCGGGGLVLLPMVQGKVARSQETDALGEGACWRLGDT